MAYTTINKSTDYFNTVLYTGNTTAPRTITGVGFQPDWNWTKNRSATLDHWIADTVKGINSIIRSSASSTNLTNPSSGYISSVNSDGYVISEGSSTDDNYNTNSSNYVSWNWKAGTTSSISGGSITPSSVSINTTSGFGIYKWTGTGSTGTIAHGLGAVPKFMLIKNLSTAESWRVYHQSLGNATSMKLNTTDASFSDTGAFYSTTPTSTLFTVGDSDSTNKSGDSIVAYVFVEKTGYSKFGEYRGNASNDGAFVYTGFRPEFIIVKPKTTADNFVVFDNKRLGYNPDNNFLYANGTNSENDADILDIVSNGFKMTNSGNTSNRDEEFIYMAFGQSLVGSNNVPCTAR